MAAPTSYRPDRPSDGRPADPSRPTDLADPGPVQESGVAAALAAAGPGAGPAGSGYRPSVVPHDLLAGVTAAHRRLVELLANVEDEVLRRPCGLPGWSVAHLLTHLARNAEGHAGMVEAASAGGVGDQYPGGRAQRDGDIEAGRDVPAAVARVAIADSVARLERAWDAVTVDGWRTGYGRVSSYGVTSLADLLFLRWREVEVHLVDLELADRGGPRWMDLDAPYLDLEWAWTVRGLPDRVPPEYTVLLAPGDRPSTAVGRGERLVIVDVPTVPALAWLTGRERGADDWPSLGPWM
ncbi:maleylpyruvate isomerase N-terminal domain-containing protein [Frankia sp. AgPm24]|uniref:maleylpyruvate isomerase N-terminal domain-containing protein n=1 Tax=Frankia sp. AgPm24 TaxID=631128 RepID=UPI00200D1361|nr:maleylpyruvate isomerase N-terminal domain-containing protein [Frankia sp. AgPm24]MCK9920546.1 maleylpyruvate isomerase N-terminal domain-containing protein [Frankia sp. AgPm24]